MVDQGDRLRRLPSVDRVVEALGARGRRDVTDLARQAIDTARARIIRGDDVDEQSVLEIAQRLVDESQRSRLQKVINGTGVLIHTNLGRAPLGERQLRAVLDVSEGYSNLEYDLNRGARGSRHDHCRDLLRAATGAEDALVVNNNAAAVLVALAALSHNKDVVVSRGELIEIGGEFRLPDVMTAAGARLVEVGTTNRTHLGDYERAVGQETGALLKVHPANYRITGFTAAVGIRDLARLARARGLPLICDLGSGLLVEASPGLGTEPVVADVVGEGADVVTFSGDKLLGGAQAGLIAGRRDLIETISRHPLMRAVRVDKMTLAVLQATLLLYVEGRHAELPLWQMLSATTEELKVRSRMLAEALEQRIADPSIKFAPAEMESLAGGGSLPGQTLPSWGVRLAHPARAPHDLAAALRHGDPPLIAWIEDDYVLIDMRTILPHDDDVVTDLVTHALGVG